MVVRLRFQLVLLSDPVGLPAVRLDEVVYHCGDRVSYFINPSLERFIRDYQSHAKGCDACLGNSLPQGIVTR